MIPHFRLLKGAACIGLVLVTATPAAACLDLVPERRTDSGTYYKVFNNCGYHVTVYFTAGAPSDPRPQQQHFWVSKDRKGDTTFIYNPQPGNYRWERAN